MIKLILLPLLVLTSCAGYIRTQSTKMISPESQGGLGTGALELRLESQKRDRLNFDDDTTNNSIDHQTADAALAAFGEVGIFKYLDIFVQPHTASATIIGAKYQIVGDPKKGAKKNNFSTSVLVGFGSGSRTYNSSGDLEDFFNENIERLKIEYSHEEIGLISGYRWSDQFLHYANAIYQQDNIKGDVTKDTGPLSTGGSYRYRQDGMIYSTGFILYFAKAQWKADYSHSITDWSKSRKDSINTLSTSIGFNW